MGVKELLLKLLDDLLVEPIEYRRYHDRRRSHADDHHR